MMIPFLLGSTSFLALAVSLGLQTQAPLLMIAFFSVGYIFPFGRVLSAELMPWYWQTAHYLFPVLPYLLL